MTVLTGFVRKPGLVTAAATSGWAAASERGAGRAHASGVEIWDAHRRLRVGLAKREAEWRRLESECSQ